MSYKAAATTAFFYSHWLLDILQTELLEKSKVIARVASFLQYLQHVAKSSILWIFYNIIPAILSQNLPLATHTTSWLQDLCNMKKKRSVANASKNITLVAAA